MLCANHTEPVKGFLGRYLRRKLIETEIEKNMRNNDLIKTIDWIPKTWHHLNTFLETHSSSDVTIGKSLQCIVLLAFSQLQNEIRIKPKPFIRFVEVELTL